MRSGNDLNPGNTAPACDPTAAMVTLVPSGPLGATRGRGWGAGTRVHTPAQFRQEASRPRGDDSWPAGGPGSSAPGRTWGRGVVQTPPPIPGPLVPPPRLPPHGRHASTGRWPREEGPRLRHLCPEHGAKSVVSKCTRFRVPTDLQGVSPKGSRRWQEPGQGKTWPRLQAPVHRWCGAQHWGVSGPGSPRLPCNLGSPTGMLLAVLLYHGRLPRLFQRNLLYSQKSKYRVPRGRPVQGPGGSQTPEEGSRGWGPR